MSLIEVEPGVRLFVQDINPRGNKTVVFIHGWPINRKTFEYQYDVLPRYGIRCVGIDLRGFGDSDKPWGGYTYDRMSDDVKAVMDALGLRNVVLAGHSMGGALVIRYMARHAGYGVAKLALLAAAAPSFTARPGYPYGMTVDQVNEFIMGLYQNRPKVLTTFGEMFFYRPITADFRSWFQNLGLEAAGYSTIKTLELLRDAFLESDLQHIRVPTGIFQGYYDRVCPYQFALELNEGIRNSELFKFNQSGHAVYYDELESFNQTFLDFIQS